MKIIDILNLIAENKIDRIPKRISYHNIAYEYNKEEGDFYSKEDGWLLSDYTIPTMLNEYVGILVDINPRYVSFKDNKIKELNVCDYTGNELKLIEGMVIKINELIGEINKIKEKINE